MECQNYFFWNISQGAVMYLSTDSWVGVGGYVDTTSRALRYSASGGNSFKQANCYTTCNNLNYRYFGLQDYRIDIGWLSACFCDNNFTHATKYGNVSCGPLGGFYCNYIYKTIVPTTAPTGLPTGRCIMILFCLLLILFLEITHALGVREGYLQFLKLCEIMFGKCGA